MKNNKILFIVFHPVEPHFFYQIIRKLPLEEYDVHFALFENEGIVIRITESYNIPYFRIGRVTKNRILRFLAIPITFIKLFYICIKFNPGLIFSATSPLSGVVAKILRIPVIGYTDTETATFNNRFVPFFFNTILLPESFYLNINSDGVVRFNGYKELAYLHPSVFTPDKSVLKILGLNETDKIVLMRFSALKAMHDIGLNSHANSSSNRILDFIKLVETKYNASVLISVTERDLDDRFNKYKLSIDPEKYIHLLSFCTLYIGEGTTTASEAGVLGVPWINIQKTTRGYLMDQENKYQLGIRTEDIDFAFNTAEQWLNKDNIKEKWHIKRLKLINEKTNVSEFISWFIMNYPESKQVMKNNPEYEKSFLGWEK